ncbi:uroporphyrinogen decarboxylase family protein [Candidatus Leptofilum sp.]|uniref:uroporphyrinogen decarboxylase family protein n=1 Tax=Candidatus Leptofilum sp. TaxID=3241576 RepID=UPI003B5BB771
MKLSRKERMHRAITYQEVDRIPTQINYTDGMGQKMAAYFNISVGDLPEFLGNHMIRVDMDHPGVLNEDGSVKFDWWGVGFDTKEEGYFAAVSPLKDNPDLDNYPWPDPTDPNLLKGAERIIKEKGDGYFITPNFGFVLFERAWTLRGFEQFFMDMAVDPEFTGELFDRITDIQLQLIHRYIDLGVTGGYFGDDYGAQKNLLFSPRMWRKYIKPRLARLFEPFKERNMPILMHSDGQIQKILPDLVEIGLTTLNPVQPEVLDHNWLEENFGGKLAFYGGVSTQTVLPYGTGDEVKTAVSNAISTLAPNNTGLLVAPSHRMMTDIPMSNVAAMLEAFKELD